MQGCSSVLRSIQLGRMVTPPRTCSLAASVATAVTTSSVALSYKGAHCQCIASDVATTIPAFISSLSLPFYRHRGLHSRRRICRFRHLRTRRLHRPHHHTRRGSSSTSPPPPPSPRPSHFATTIPAFVAAAIASVIATVISAPVAASVVFIVRSRRLHRPHHHIPVAASIQPG